MASVVVLAQRWQERGVENTSQIHGNVKSEAPMSCVVKKVNELTLDWWTTPT